jgi:hypothetical protein
MTAFDMPRKSTKLRLDERVLNALRAAADKNDLSFNGLIETILFNYAKGTGELPIDAEPLGESRGGKRDGAGRKPKAESVEQEP